MAAYDPQKVQRVWNRVQGQPESFDAGSIPELIAQEWLDAATYLVLSRRFQGRDSVLLRQLFQQEQDHVACLKGLYTLLTGTRPVVHTPQVPKDDTEKLLRKVYGSHMQRLAQYEAKRDAPEFGQLFVRLAAQEREQCHSLLSLLGRLKT